MAITDLVIPSCLNPQFFESKIDTGTKGVWYDICGGAAPVSGTIININEIIPSKYTSRAGQPVVFNTAAPRMVQMVLTPWDYANLLRPDVAAQDQGKAIERDMLVAAAGANVFGDSLIPAGLTATGIDAAALIGTHGTQNNTLATGVADGTLTRAQADVQAAKAIDLMRNLLDDATGSIRYLNVYAQKFVICTSSANRFSLYMQSMMDHTGACILPGYANKWQIDVKPIPGLPAKKDYIFRLDGEPALLSGIYGETIWAGYDPYSDVYKWYHRFSQGMVPFRWQSVQEIVYT